MSENEAVVHDVFDEIARDRTVTDATYARAVAALGEPGVVDLLGAIGYYSTLAMIMNVARTPAPPAPWALGRGAV
jgi:4-carboxymuconolactone decarboxylase